MTTVDREEVIVLTEALMDKAINPEEFKRLEKWLKDDPTARALYLEHCTVDALLRWRWQPEPLNVNVTDQELMPDKLLRFPQSNSSSIAGILKIAAALAALLLAGVLISQWENGSVESFAEIEAEEGVQWRVVSDEQDANGRQTLLVTEGTLDVTFASGARVSIEGPSLFEIRGENEAMMEWGKGSFQVPDKAKGYTVNTPWGKVVDLGTAFDLAVTNEGLAEVKVTEGKVRVVAKGEQQELLMGESLVMSRNGLSENKNLQMGGAPSGGSNNQLGYQQMIRESKPVAYWPFDGKEGALITEKGIVKLVPGPRPPEFPLFDESNTAAFFGDQGMLRMQDRGENSPFDFSNDDEITIEAWVNPDDQVHEGGIVYIVGKGRTDNLAFLKDNQNFSLRLWKVKGQMKATFLFRSAPDGEWEGDYHRWTTLKGFVPGDGWHHVAATYRYGEPESIRTYQDGKLMAGEWDMGGASTRRPVVDDDELWLGAAKGGAQGNKFTGMVDEVAIYRKVLTPEQILERVQKRVGKE